MHLMRQQDTLEKITDHEVLRDLVPFNALSREHMEELLEKLVVEEVKAGGYLFCEGDRDNRSIYLLDGEISLIDKRGKITGIVLGGTEPGRYPLANLQPRYVSARVTKKSIIAYIDFNFLDSVLALDQCVDCKQDKTVSETRDDWLERFLQSEAFVELEPEKIKQLCDALVPVKVKAGNVVFHEGDEADNLYILREGRCSVSSCVSSEGWEVPLSELEEGNFFGEESLVPDARRHASATMLTDGKLMRLSRRDCIELLREPLIHFVDYELAVAMVENGDTWLDVRLTDEYANYALKGSMNIPLLSLREMMQELDITRRYIICCDTGMRSTSAAFLLSHAGFEVHVLTEGMRNAVPADVLGLVDNSPAIETESMNSALEWSKNPGIIPEEEIDAENLEQLNRKLEKLQRERDNARGEAREAKKMLARLQDAFDALQTKK